MNVPRLRVWAALPVIGISLAERIAFNSPALWIGLAITAIFLAAAVRLRRDRGWWKVTLPRLPR